MAYQFFQISVNGQSDAADALNKLLHGGRIASVRKEFVPDGENAFDVFS